MRPFLATCLGAACTAALALPPGPALVRPAEAAAGSGAARTGDLPGATQSLPLDGLGRRAAAPHGPTVREVSSGTRRPFSLVGVVWDDAATPLPGRAEVRTRARGSGRWSGWQNLATAGEDAPDPGAGEGRGGTARGSTAPLWVGASDAVQLRLTLTPGTTPGPTGGVDAASPATRAVGVLPHGLRLELVDPGPDTPALRGAPPTGPEAVASSAANAPLAPLGATEIPAADELAARADLAAVGGTDPAGPAHIGARPRIVTRAGWGADEMLREARFAYTRTVRAAFVHHSGTGNNYTCAEAPSVIRAMYRFHVLSSHWRDIGYNFLIDRCGTVYEGRAGGVAKPVLGAHTLGFNNDSTGIALLGTFEETAPPRAAVTALARLTAWKLGLHGADPLGRASMTSTGGDRYPKGTVVRQRVISGHRDGVKTECPGALLYADLPAVRQTAARLQGR
ncbi:N-acetylmuramoyl-L-alanine amidase [Streptomyces sp. NPDC093707]|uniref:N-acetylmuramoyl-L-alanine amidase n=1 Tax=Streptomyces sp. NPDC093707 TaxID=3154984 RepID=UPI00344C8644